MGVFHCGLYEVLVQVRNNLLLEDSVGRGGICNYSSSYGGVCVSELSIILT
jgi:hypothetical protein